MAKPRTTDGHLWQNPAPLTGTCGKAPQTIELLRRETRTHPDGNQASREETGYRRKLTTGALTMNLKTHTSAARFGMWQLQCLAWVMTMLACLIVAASGQAGTRSAHAAAGRGVTQSQSAGRHHKTHRHSQARHHRTHNGSAVRRHKTHHRSAVRHHATRRARTASVSGLPSGSQVGDQPVSSTVHCDLVAAPTGSDTTGLGTTAAPFRTLAKLDQALSPGQQGCLRAGVYGDVSTWHDLSNSGTGTAQITISAYPGETAKVIGWVDLEGSYTTVSHLQIDGSNNLYKTHRAGTSCPRLFSS